MEEVLNEVVEEKKKPSKKKKILALVISLVTVGFLVFLALLLILGIPFGKYLYTINLMDKGQYKEAIDTFTDLGDYEDAPAQITECRYRIALRIMEEKSYPQAIESFTALGSYKDCPDRVTECKYLLAQVTMADKDYAGAQAQFEALQDYKDSAEMVLECKYQQAVLMIDEGKIVNAYEALTALGDYSDSADLQRTIKPIYRRILAKPNLFVNNLWDEENQTRIWVETTVLDSNTMYINITGSNGADDHSSEDLNGIWDESIGMVKFNGVAYRTKAGYTYCTNDNVVGYLYYKNGYLCLVYGENPDASPMRFQ